MCQLMRNLKIQFDYGGGIYVKNTMNISNCSLSNCSTNGKGGGICSNSYSSIIVNCAVFNCYASEYSGGIYVFDTSTVVKNCASSNNSSAGVIGSGIVGSQLNCISPMITNTYIQPTNFIGISTTDEQNVELINANCRLKDGSPCINAGAKYNYYSVEQSEFFAVFFHHFTATFVVTSKHSAQHYKICSSNYKIFPFFFKF